MIIIDKFYIISITKIFQLIIPSVLNILICVHYLPYFLEKGSQRKFKLQKIIDVPIQYPVYLKFNDTLLQMPNYDFHIFVISSKSYRRHKTMHYVSHENQRVIPLVFLRLYLNN